MRITKREQAIVSLSVTVLREALLASDHAPINTDAVRLALRCLLPHCPERWPLVGYWDSSSQDNAIGRSQGCTAAFNGILVQLRKSGAWRE
ncbi:MAG: hypothetical protein JWR85_3602 [Marmoricola sp.]|nr:hypothetical protein [Marmoricola sp.]